MPDAEKKRVAFLKANATSLIEAENYLKKRGFAVMSFLEPQELIDFASKYSPHYLFLAFDHPHRSLPLLNSVLRDYVEYPVAYFSESGSVATAVQMELQRDELEIISGASGPQFERWMTTAQKKALKQPRVIQTRKEPKENKAVQVQKAQQALTRQVNLYALYSLSENNVAEMLKQSESLFYGEKISNLDKQSLFTRILILSTLATTAQEEVWGNPSNDRLSLLTFESEGQSGFCLVEGLMPGVAEVYLRTWQKLFQKGFASAQENLTFRGPIELASFPEFMTNLNRCTEISVEYHGVKIRYLSSWDHPLGILKSPLKGFQRVPLDIIPVQFSLNFNLYIHLEKPDEALLYVPQGLKILAPQIGRLKAKNILYGLIKTEDTPCLDALFLTKRIEPFED